MNPKIPRLEPPMRPLPRSKPEGDSLRPFPRRHVRRRSRASFDPTILRLLLFLGGGLAGIGVAYYVASLFPQWFAL